MIKLTYIGRRWVFSEDQIQQVFLNEKGQEQRYTKVKHPSIGSIYKGEAKGAINTRPEYLGEVEDEEKVAGWVAEDAAAEVFLKRFRASSKLAQRKDLHADLNRLLKHTKGLGFIELRAFMEFATDYLYEKGQKK